MSIEVRLRRLEDEKAILETLHAYGHHLDYGLEDAWIDCWTRTPYWIGPGGPSCVGTQNYVQGFAPTPMRRSCTTSMW